MPSQTQVRIEQELTRHGEDSLKHASLDVHVDGNYLSNRTAHVGSVGVPASTMSARPIQMPVN
jgi:hypothetical protein